MERHATPETFHGRNSEGVAQRLFSIEQYFLASRVIDELQKVNYAASLLRGSAALWWRQLVEIQEGQVVGKPLLMP